MPKVSMTIRVDPELKAAAEASGNASAFTNEALRRRVDQERRARDMLDRWGTPSANDLARAAEILDDPGHQGDSEQASP